MLIFNILIKNLYS